MQRIIRINVSMAWELNRKKKGFYMFFMQNFNPGSNPLLSSVLKKVYQSKKHFSELLYKYFEMTGLCRSFYSNGGIWKELRFDKGNLISGAIYNRRSKLIIRKKANEKWENVNA